MRLPGNFSTLQKAKNMRQVKQRGFTLIELVMVIVILGVLAVVAIPKFLDLRSDAVVAATAGVAGTLSSASAINYASRNANSAKGSAVATCVDVGTLLKGGLPTPYTITAGTTVAANAVVTTCVVNNPNAASPASATFSAFGLL